MARVNLVALILIVPISLLYALPYYFYWGRSVFEGIKFITLSYFLMLIPVGIILHELLHGLTWALFAKNGTKAIQYGIKWEYLTPYCHCKDPLRVWQYITGGLMPLLFMGIVPAIWALYAGNSYVIFISMFFSWAAGGDIFSVWTLRKFRLNQMVLDHPKELGFIILDSSQTNL